MRSGDEVVTTRRIRAGLREDGPLICEAGVKGRIVKIENDEPDGVHVVLENGAKWWFKPGQLRLRVQ